MNDMADRGSVGLLFKHFNLFRLEIRSATQATRNEDNWSTAEHDDNFKTPNEKKLSSSWWEFSTKQFCFLMNIFNYKKLCPDEHDQLHSTSNGHPASHTQHTRVKFWVFSSRQCCRCKITHQEEESFFSFGVLKLSSCSAVDQLSSFRVACVADRISSRNKLKFFKSKPTDPRSAMSFMCNLSGV